MRIFQACQRHPNGLSPHFFEAGKKSYLFRIVLFIISNLIAGNLLAQAGTKTTTVSYFLPVSLSKQNAVYFNSSIRYNLELKGSLLQINANGIRNFPGSIRKIIFYKQDGFKGREAKPRFRKIGKAGRRKIRDSMRRQFENYLGERIVWDRMRNNSIDSMTYVNRERINFSKYLYGKYSGNTFPVEWHILAGISIDTQEKTVYRARINIPRRKDIYVYCDTIPVSSYAFLPQVGRSTCQPINRIFDFKRLKGFGYDNIRPRRYIPSKRKVFKKEFEIYFDRNSSIVDPDLLQPVIQFLENNKYSIMNASVQGYASVEGPKENNYKLQQRRAELMIRILQEHNEDEISLDTVIATENWDMFFDQVKDSPFQYLDSLSRDSLRILLKDSLLLVKLEPLLKKERKAVLSLTLANIFSPEEINSNILFDMRELAYHLSTDVTGKFASINDSKAAGLLYRVNSRVEHGLIKAKEVTNTLRMLNNPELWVMNFYVAIHNYEVEQKEPLLFNWPEIFRMAQYGIVDLIEYTRNPALKNIYVRQAVDIQYYAYQFMLKNKIDWELICSLDYPDEAVFYPLILNRYAFIFNYATGHGAQISCYPDINFNNRYHADWYDSGHYYFHGPMRMISIPSEPDNSGSGWKQTPSVNSSPKGAYYYFLKKIFVDNDESIRQYVYQSDNLYEFDLFELLYRNIEYWDPVNNIFYDSEIGLKEMYNLVEKLHSIDQRICPMQKEQLYLDFYLKCLYYYKLRGNPYDPDMVVIINRSIRYISDYYRLRLQNLTPDILRAVTAQLNFFQNLPGRENPAYLSYRILKEYNYNAALTDPEEKLLWQKASFYEGNFRTFSKRLSHSPADFCSFFKGPFRIKPWREDVRELFSEECNNSLR